MHLEIPALSDMHVHFRQGTIISEVAPFTGRYCAHVLAMPNTGPPLLSYIDAVDYGFQLNKQLPWTVPLLTIKLTMRTDPAMIEAASKAGVTAAKLYPEGVTTNSKDGIHQGVLLSPQLFSLFMDTLGAMEKWDMVLCLHGEMPGEFCLDREEKFLPFVHLIHGHFPKLRVVLEHITTRMATGYVETYASGPLAATITAHHLCLTLDDVVGDKIQPHNFCKPIAKYPHDLVALRKAACSGDPRFFLGSDSAPHRREDKECSHGCAGVFTAPLLPQLLAQEFDDMDALSRLEGFTSRFANEFYQMPPATRKIRLVKSGWTVPQRYEDFVPFKAGEKLTWSLE